MQLPLLPNTSYIDSVWLKRFFFAFRHVYVSFCLFVLKKKDEELDLANMVFGSTSNSSASNRVVLPDNVGKKLKFFIEKGYDKIASSKGPCDASCCKDINPEERSKKVSKHVFQVCKSCHLQRRRRSSPN